MTTETRRRLFTITEYYQMAAAGIFGYEERVELIEGHILEMYPRGVRHIWAVSRLGRIFARRDDVIASVFNPLRLDGRTEPVPDIAVLRTDSPQDRQPAPEYTYLVIEVADESLDYDQHVEGADSTAERVSRSTGSSI